MHLPLSVLLSERNLTCVRFKPKSGKKYFVKHQIKIKEGIKELINEIKNKKK